MSNILKPHSASRRWKASRPLPPARQFNAVREPFVPTVNTGKSKRLPAFKHAPFDVSAHQRAAHLANVDKPHIISANKAEKLGHFGGKPKRLRKYPNGKHAVELPTGS